MSGSNFAKFNVLNILVTNGCSNKKGECSHLCIPKPYQGYKCECRDGFVLQPDGVSCDQSKNIFSVDYFFYRRLLCILDGLMLTLYHKA